MLSRMPQSKSQAPAAAAATGGGDDGFTGVNAVICSADVKNRDVDLAHALYKLHVSPWASASCAPTSSTAGSRRSSTWCSGTTRGSEVLALGARPQGVDRHVARLALGPRHRRRPALRDAQRLLDELLDGNRAFSLSADFLPTTSIGRRPVGFLSTSRLERSPGRVAPVDPLPLRAQRRLRRSRRQPKGCPHRSSSCACSGGTPTSLRNLRARPGLAPQLRAVQDDRLRRGEHAGQSSARRRVRCAGRREVVAHCQSAPEELRDGALRGPCLPRHIRRLLPGGGRHGLLDTRRRRPGAARRRARHLLLVLVDASPLTTTTHHASRRAGSPTGCSSAHPARSCSVERPAPRKAGRLHNRLPTRVPRRRPPAQGRKAVAGHGGSASTAELTAQNDVGPAYLGEDASRRSRGRRPPRRRRRPDERRRRGVGVIALRQRRRLCGAAQRGSRIRNLLRRAPAPWASAHPLAAERRRRVHVHAASPPSVTTTAAALRRPPRCTRSSSCPTCPGARPGRRRPQMLAAPWRPRPPARRAEARSPKTLTGHDVGWPRRRLEPRRRPRATQAAAAAAAAASPAAATAEALRAAQLARITRRRPAYGIGGARPPPHPPPPPPLRPSPSTAELPNRQGLQATTSMACGHASPGGAAARLAHAALRPDTASATAILACTSSPTFCRRRTRFRRGWG